MFNASTFAQTLISQETDGALIFHAAITTPTNFPAYLELIFHNDDLEHTQPIDLFSFEGATETPMVCSEFYSDGSATYLTQLVDPAHFSAPVDLLLCTDGDGQVVHMQVWKSWMNEFVAA